MTYLGLFVGGAFGGFIRQLVVGKGSIILWHRWYDDKSGKHGVDLGILSSLIVGGVVGLIVDQSMFTAFSWGMTGTYILEEMMKRELNKSSSGEVK
jgi:hypothetical protein